MDSQQAADAEAVIVGLCSTPFGDIDGFTYGKRRTLPTPTRAQRLSATLMDSLPCAFYLFIRVMEITDILSQNVPLEDVQYLAGHSNPSGHTDL